MAKALSTTFIACVVAMIIDLVAEVRPVELHTQAGMAIIAIGLLLDSMFNFNAAPPPLVAQEHSH